MRRRRKRREANISTTHSHPLVSEESGRSDFDLTEVAPRNDCRLESELSERGQTLKGLQESEQRYREFFENAKDAIYIHDLSGRYTLANRAGEELLGYTREEILGMRIFDVVPEDQISEVRENLTKKLDDHAPTMYEVEIIRKDGSRVPVEVNSRLIFEHGIPVAVQGMARDISERRQAEAELRDSEERFRALTQTASDGILLIDEGSRMRLVNPAVEKIFGYKAEELLGQDLSMLMPERFREAHYSAVARYLRAGQKQMSWSSVELPGLHRSGQEIPLELSFAEFTTRGERFFAGIARDISERKQDQEILRASEERFRDLIENANDTIFTCDMSGQFTSLNKAGEKLTGYSPAEAPNVNFADVVAPEYLETARQMLSRKTADDVATVYELEIVTRSGKRAAVEISSRSILIDGKPSGVQGVARDITERKKMSEALRASQVQLQQSQKLEAVGQLAGGVAHDFNNLLTAIIGYSELSLRRLTPENPLTRNIEEVKRAAERAASLTRQLLAFSRKQILEPKVLDLNNVVQDMHGMLRRLIGEDLNLVMRLEKDLGTVKADPGQIEQIIMNLVVNARDAMPRGGLVTIETDNVSLDDQYARDHQPVLPGDYALMAISDEGIGMDSETQARIFEPFFTTKELGKGTGLGLSTVYGIVKQSGGYIWVYSEVGVGTTFKVYLPLINETSGGDVIRSLQKPAPRGSETLLLVEDDEQVLLVAREILESQGYRVLSAPGGEAALSLALLYPDPIHLVITDVVMPQMSGRELAEQLTVLRPDLRVLYMSGYTDDAIVRHGLLEEQMEFIQKPFTADSLARKVRHTLGDGA